jgi:hypothetical protein
MVRRESLILDSLPMPNETSKYGLLIVIESSPQLPEHTLLSPNGPR